jgi:serine/threonine protein kinase
MFTNESPAEFEQEVRMMRAVTKHPNVIDLTATLDDGSGRRSVLLPLMARSLEDYYDRNGVIAADVLKQFVCQIASGLSHMHKSGIAHLDLKCGNILLTSSNVCKICDFGMAERFSGSDDVSFKGTHSFMAPEVWRQSKNCDLSKVDIYAFSMLIWELLAAQLPWSRLYVLGDRDNNININNNDNKWHIDIKTKVLLSQRPDVDIRWDSLLRSIITRCWNQDPNSRPTAEDASLPLGLEFENKRLQIDVEASRKRQSEFEESNRRDKLKLDGAMKRIADLESECRKKIEKIEAEKNRIAALEGENRRIREEFESAKR